jgi:hypothetical protein
MIYIYDKTSIPITYPSLTTPTEPTHPPMCHACSAPRVPRSASWSRALTDPEAVQPARTRPVRTDCSVRACPARTYSSGSETDGAVDVSDRAQAMREAHRQKPNVTPRFAVVPPRTY